MNKDHSSQILIDTGAGESMMGDAWLAKHKRIVEDNPHQFPQPVYSTSPVQGSKSVSGVGTGSSQLTHMEKIPIKVPGRSGIHHYQGFVMEGSECPALLGAKSLTQFGAIIDLRSLKPTMYLTKHPNDIIICVQNSANTSQIELSRTEGGHITMPAAGPLIDEAL